MLMDMHQAYLPLTCTLCTGNSGIMQQVHTVPECANDDNRSKV